MFTLFILVSLVFIVLIPWVIVRLFQWMSSGSSYNSYDNGYVSYTPPPTSTWTPSVPSSSEPSSYTPPSSSYSDPTPSYSSPDPSPSYSDTSSSSIGGDVGGGDFGGGSFGGGGSADSY